MGTTPERPIRASSGSLSSSTQSPPRQTTALPPPANQTRVANKQARRTGLESGSDSSELTDEDKVALRAKKKGKRARKPRKQNSMTADKGRGSRWAHSLRTSGSTVNGAHGGSGSGGASISGSQAQSSSRSSRVIVPQALWEWAHKKNKPAALGRDIAPNDDTSGRGQSSGPESVQLGDCEVEDPPVAGSEANSSCRKTQATFKCPWLGCGRTYTREASLLEHTRSHTGEKPFKCRWPECDKAFARSQGCKRHELLHLSIRPYRCEECQKTFTRMDALNQHLRSECGIEHSEQEALATHHSPEQRENVELESETGTPTSRGTKRRQDKVEEQNDEEQRGEPKRGKIVHRDYADMETDDPVSDTRPTLTIQSGQITCEEMFQHLVAHGCADLSSDIDPGGYSSGLIQGGAFGDIWKGKLRDGTEVAIKVWRFSSLLHNGSKSMERAMREIYYWSKAKHVYVQELMGVTMFQGRLGMVSLWMEHGNLREYICKNPNADRYSLCYQVASGIAYLHSREMVHGDLKGTNILVSRGGVAKLSDFDHSIMLECSIAFSETSKLGGGTTRWMAPELILDDECNRSAYTDVYALGKTMLEIITGSSPYSPQCKDDVNVIKAIMKKRLPARPMDCLSNSPRDNRMWELLLRCWDYEPLLRPKATEVVESLQHIIALSAIRAPA